MTLLARLMLSPSVPGPGPAPPDAPSAAPAPVDILSLALCREMEGAFWSEPEDVVPMQLSHLNRGRGVRGGMEGRRKRGREGGREGRREGGE